MSVALVPITRENVSAVCELAVRDDQRNFVAPAGTTIAEAGYHEPGAFLRAIAFDDEPVGVVWVQTDEPVPFTELELSYVPAEGGAERFWLASGFEPTGRMREGEAVVRMDL